MKRVRCIIAVFLACWMSAACLCTPALAVDHPKRTQSIVYFEDGSYLVTTITEDSQAETGRSSANTKSGTKHHDYYSGSRELAWTFRVHGTFTYDGLSAKATSADYSYDIYDPAWSFSGGSASYSGATATADGSFTYRFIPNPVTVSLTCSAKGVLS